jgi:hypothetical protein
MNRRDFIKTIIRNLILSGILFISGYLLFKKKSQEKCNFDFACKNCKRQKTCELPEAEVNKKNQ